MVIPVVIDPVKHFFVFSDPANDEGIGLGRRPVFETDDDRPGMNDTFPYRTTKVNFNNIGKLKSLYFLGKQTVRELKMVRREIKLHADTPQDDDSQ